MSLIGRPKKKGKRKKLERTEEEGRKCEEELKDKISKYIGRTKKMRKKEKEKEGEE